jgi:hypothetical protein
MPKRLLVAVLACAGTVATPAHAANPVTYPAVDSAPDTTGAPDIANVVVSDTTQGLITFQLNFVPGTEQQAQDSFNVYIDSDQNPTTGDLTGAGTEYLLQYDGLPGGGLGLFKWDGKSSYQFLKSTSLRGSFTGDAQYFSIAASELGIGDGFNFNVAAAVGEDPSKSSQVDYLPENGTNFHYSMQSKAVIRLSVADWEDSSVPRAGKAYTTALLVNRSDTGSPLTSGGTIQCALIVHGRPAPLIEKGFLKIAWYKGAPRVAAVCMWRLPATSQGLHLAAKETVGLGGATASRVFTFAVRK